MGFYTKVTQKYSAVSASTEEEFECIYDQIWVLCANKSALFTLRAYLHFRIMYHLENHWTHWFYILKWAPALAFTNGSDFANEKQQNFNIESVV